MKKIRQIIKNPVFLSGLLLVSLAGIWTWMAWGKKIVKKSGNGLVFDNFDSFCVNQFCLDKEEGIWTVNDTKTKIPANSEAIEIMIDRLKEIKLKEKASENSNKFEEMGIGGKTKVLVIAGNRKLELGKISSDYTGTYVRENEGKTVYKTEVVLDKESMLTLDYWSKKTISNLPRYQIKKVTIKKGSQSKELIPKEGKWEDEKWIDKVAFLNSVKYLDGFKPDESNKVEIEIEMEKEKAKLILGKNKINSKNYIYWASNEGKYYFEIKKEDFDLLTGIVN